MPEINMPPKLNPALNPELNSMTPELSDAFCALISDRTGLTFKSSAQRSVNQKIMARVQAMDYLEPMAYYQLLGEHSLESHQEWQQLSELLTNGESFFFRDRGQFSALEHHILPELIQKNTADKRIRICSAGCSTGEEAYSIAILLSQLIAQPEEWDILVYGVDLNPAAISQAQEGLYRAWSLRGLSPQQKTTYFQRVQNRYQIAPQFKQWVRFQQLNLVDDALTVPGDQVSVEETPKEETPREEAPREEAPREETPREEASVEEISESFDLIVCRNVFIYFTKAAIAKVIQKIYQALCPEGYLLAGHSELYEQNLDAFHAKVLPGSLIFQRPADGQCSNTSMLADELSVDLEDIVAAQDRNVANKSDTAFKSFQKAQSTFKKKSFVQALQHTNQSLALQPDNVKALLLMAQIRNALGHTEAAKHYCYQALKIDPSFMPPHYILAKILTSQGNLAIAKRLLKKIIYLDPTSVVAYLELSQIYEQENNLKKSTLMRQSAFKIFKQHLSPSTVLDPVELSTEDLLDD